MTWQALPAGQTAGLRSRRSSTGPGGYAFAPGSLFKALLMTTQLTLLEPEAETCAACNIPTGDPEYPCLCRWSARYESGELGACPECGQPEHDEWGAWQRADGVWVCLDCGLRPETEEKRDVRRD